MIVKAVEKGWFLVIPHPVKKTQSITIIAPDTCDQYHTLQVNHLSSIKVLSIKDESTEEFTR